MENRAEERAFPLKTSGGLPKSWEQAIAAGFVTRGMAEILVAPDPIPWRTLDTVPTPDEVRQRYRDRCEQQNQKREYRPPE